MTKQNRDPIEQGQRARANGWRPSLCGRSDPHTEEPMKETTIWRCAACGAISSIGGPRRGLRSVKCATCEGVFFPVPAHRKAEIQDIEAMAAERIYNEQQAAQ